MARHSLVAVGGSGQSAAIAYLRLATLSGIHPGDLPNIYPNSRKTSGFSPRI